MVQRAGTAPKYELTLLMSLGVGVLWLLSFSIIPEPLSWVMLLMAHLVLPTLAFFWSRKSAPWMGFAFGPGALLIVYGFLLLRWATDLWGGIGEDTWLAWMVWGICAAAFAIYTLYSLLITRMLRRRYRKRHAF